ncbi:MAG: glycoside hydrolase family protein [Opitutales bacterium]
MKIIPTFLVQYMIILGALCVFTSLSRAVLNLPQLPPDVKVSYPDSNPLRDALRPVPETAFFSMEGYYLWDPSVIKVGDTYHLFCSRWKVDEKGMEGWRFSHVIRATSKSLFGPYAFQEVVLHPGSHPWATRMIHNPKVTKVGEQYLLYHLGDPGWATGFAFASAITGPWEPVKKPIFKGNNPAILLRDDGSAYAVTKFKPERHKDGRWDAYMAAWEAPAINGPYKRIAEGNRLPGNFELEDPTIWWANDQYNVICTDWEAKVTGVEKAPVYYTSNDGVHYTLYSQIPLIEPVPGIKKENGKFRAIDKFERPEVYLNEQGEVIALLGAVRPAEDIPTYIVIVPVDNFTPEN